MAAAIISLLAPNLVAAWTPMLGLHSSSWTSSSYSYLALGSVLRKRTARSAELRPPMPLDEVPPLSGPMKPTVTFSLAIAGDIPSANPATITAAAEAAARCVNRRFRMFVILPDE